MWAPEVRLVYFPERGRQHRLRAARPSASAPGFSRPPGTPWFFMPSSVPSRSPRDLSRPPHSHPAHGSCEGSARERLSFFLLLNRQRKVSLSRFPSQVTPGQGGSPPAGDQSGASLIRGSRTHLRLYSAPSHCAFWGVQLSQWSFLWPVHMSHSLLTLWLPAVVLELRCASPRGLITSCRAHP